MNITEQIIDNLESIGYHGRISTIVKYFINENIKSIYGTAYMNPNDFILYFEDDSIDLKSIFNEGHNIISVSYDSTQGTTTVKCDQVVKNKITRVFEMIDSPNAIENRCFAEDGVQKKYTYDKTNVSFGFEVSHKDEEKQVVDFKGTLTPIYSKTKNFDWFSYSRECPPIEKERSLFKRIIDELSNRGYSRQIITSDDATIDLDEFPDSIFGTLIKEAETVVQNNGKSEKKRNRI